MELHERYLMCPPKFYQIDYVINPWMEGNIDRASATLAAKQWKELYGILARHAAVDIITPYAGSPDMVFTANAGLVRGHDAVISRFLHRERQGENRTRTWFQQNGFRVHELPKDLPLKAGDAVRPRGADSLGELWVPHRARYS
jgi:N-dimethylarginine dimethylaminohydrolase